MTEIGDHHENLKQFREPNVGMVVSESINQCSSDIFGFLAVQLYLDGINVVSLHLEYEAQELICELLWHHVTSLAFCHRWTYEQFVLSLSLRNEVILALARIYC
jgi:hypothetical protein